MSQDRPDLAKSSAPGAPGGGGEGLLPGATPGTQPRGGRQSGKGKKNVGLSGFRPQYLQISTIVRIYGKLQSDALPIELRTRYEDIPKFHISFPFPPSRAHPFFLWGREGIQDHLRGLLDCMDAGDEAYEVPLPTFVVERVGEKRLVSYFVAALMPSTPRQFKPTEKTTRSTFPLLTRPRPTSSAGAPPPPPPQLPPPPLPFHRRRLLRRRALSARPPRAQGPRPPSRPRRPS
jgi:hypothetical protein